MNLISAIAALAFAATSVTCQNIMNFQDFLKKYNKHYEGTELTHREKLFEANVAKVEKHNAMNLTYTLGVNQFSDMEPAEYEKFSRGKARNRGDFTFLEPPKDFMRNLKPVKDLPASVDWRQKGVTSPVKNQGGCGSCWAFSATEVLESHAALQSGKLLTLSPQQLVDCAPNPDSCGGTGGCQGSTQWLAFNYTSTVGLSLESDYPYRGRDMQCNAGQIKSAAQNKGYVRLPTNDYTALMNAIATLGPIAISVAANDWMFYSSGVFDGPCDNTIDHAVVLEGYGPGYYLVRNSWGESWGEKGYIRVKRTDDDGTTCGTDKKPSDGTDCKPYPKEKTVCGLCGILSDSSYPTGVSMSKSDVVAAEK